MRVQYNYLPNEFEDVTSILAKWEKLIRSTEFTLGPFVEEFESAFSTYVGAKHCISTNNGTDALILALKSLGVGYGDEVISVSNTFYASIGAIVACGATPVLVDCDDRYQIDPLRVKSAINSKTKAILPVHWAGASPDMDQILSIADEHGLLIIEDACMGIGGSWRGQHPGTFGNVGAFSMHPLKSLNVMGDGGMVVTNDDKVASWMRMYRNHGMKNRDEIEIWGVNMRLQPLQAIVAMEQLNKLNDTVLKRGVNASMLDHELDSVSPYIKTPSRLGHNKETFSLYMCLAENRDELLAFLHEKGVEAKVHYPIPLHKQNAANNDCIIDRMMDKVEYQASRLITLPIHQFLSKEQVQYTGEVIREFYQ